MTSKPEKRPAKPDAQSVDGCPTASRESGLADSTGFINRPVQEIGDRFTDLDRDVPRRIAQMPVTSI